MWWYNGQEHGVREAPHTEGPEGGKGSEKETEVSRDRLLGRGKPQSATSVAAEERRKLLGLCN